MIVSVHGSAKVPEGMWEFERYYGEIEEYNGDYDVLYTDQKMSKNEYYYLKYKLLRKNVELIHSKWNDDTLNEFVEYLSARSDENRPRGRVKFGFERRNGAVVENARRMEIARKVIELRDSGMTYRGIKSELNLNLCITTIQTICRNRELYEKGK